MISGFIYSFNFFFVKNYGMITNNNYYVSKAQKIELAIKIDFDETLQTTNSEQ